MLLQKRVDRAFKWLKDKNKPTEEASKEIQDGEGENLDHLEEDIELEDKDFLAMLISSMVVFAPVVIMLLLIAAWAFFS